MAKPSKAARAAKKAALDASSGKGRKAAEDRFVHHEDITPHEFTAFKEYQGAHYGDINAHLRQTIGAPYALPAAIAQIPHLKSLVGKQSLAGDTTVYRGLTAHEGFDPSQYKAGDIYQDRGFFSTSLKRSAAEGFVDKLDPKSQSVLFHINVPKGTKAIPGYKLGTGSSFQKSEREVLFAPDSSVKLSKVRKDKSGIFHFYGTLH